MGRLDRYTKASLSKFFSHCFLVSLVQRKNRSIFAELVVICFLILPVNLHFFIFLFLLDCLFPNSMQGQ